jgi:hypothetical protein
MISGRAGCFVRIMMVSESYIPSVGGAAVATGRLALGIERRGHEVAVVAPSPTGRPFVEGAGGVVTYRTWSIPNHFVPENMLPHAPGVLLRFPAISQWVRRQLWQDFVRVYRQFDAVTCPSDADATLVRSQGLELYKKASERRRPSA